MNAEYVIEECQWYIRFPTPTHQCVAVLKVPVPTKCNTLYILANLLRVILIVHPLRAEGLLVVLEELDRILAVGNDGPISAAVAQ